MFPLSRHMFLVLSLEQVFEHCEQIETKQNYKWVHNNTGAYWQGPYNSFVFEFINNSL